MRKALLALMVLLSLVSPVAADNEGSVYDRVMKTGVIRCGYTTWMPFFMKDPNTGKFSGIWYDVMQEVGKALDVKIEWSEEVSLANYITALEHNRIDMYCSDEWPTATRGKHVEYTSPIAYLAVGAVVRAEDRRFDNAFEKIDAPDVTVTTIEGDMSAIIAKKNFPRAKLLELPALSDISMALNNVASGKADVTFVDRLTAAIFMKNNLGKIRFVPAERPLRLFGDVLAAKLGEHKFVTMVDTALVELVQSGAVDDIIDRYEEVPGTFYRVAKPYVLPR